MATEDKIAARVIRTAIADPDFKSHAGLLSEVFPGMQLGEKELALLDDQINISMTETMMATLGGGRIFQAEYRALFDTDQEYIEHMQGLQQSAGIALQEIAETTLEGATTSNIEVLALVARLTTPMFMRSVFPQLTEEQASRVCRANVPLFNRAVMLPLILAFKGQNFGLEDNDKTSPLLRSVFAQIPFQFPLRTKDELMLFLSGLYHPGGGLMNLYLDNSAFVSGDPRNPNSRRMCPAIDFARIVFDQLHKEFISPRFVKDF